MSGLFAVDAGTAKWKRESPVTDWFGMSLVASMATFFQELWGEVYDTRVEVDHLL